MRLEACSFNLCWKSWLVYVRYTCLLPTTWGKLVNNGFEGLLNNFSEGLYSAYSIAYQRAKALITVKMLAGRPAPWDDQRLIVVSYADIVTL